MTILIWIVFIFKCLPGTNKRGKQNFYKNWRRRNIVSPFEAFWLTVLTPFRLFSCRMLILELHRCLSSHSCSLRSMHQVDRGQFFSEKFRSTPKSSSKTNCECTAFHLIVTSHVYLYSTTLFFCETVFIQSILWIYLILYTTRHKPHFVVPNRVLLTRVYIDILKS